MIKVFKKKKFLIGGLIVVLAIAYLGYTGFEGSATYYFTVSELAAQEGSVNGENVRVNGQVAAGSVEQDTKEQIKCIRDRSNLRIKRIKENMGNSKVKGS